MKLKPVKLNIEIYPEAVINYMKDSALSAQDSLFHPFHVIPEAARLYIS